MWICCGGAGCSNKVGNSDWVDTGEADTSETMSGTIESKCPVTSARGEPSGESNEVTAGMWWTGVSVGAAGNETTAGETKNRNKEHDENKARNKEKLHFNKVKQETKLEVYKQNENVDFRSEMSLQK